MPESPERKTSSAPQMREVHATGFMPNKLVDPSEQATMRAPEDILAEHEQRERDILHAGFILIQKRLPDPYLEEHPEILDK